MASKKKKEESDEDLAWGRRYTEIVLWSYVQKAMEAGLLSYDGAGEDLFLGEMDLLQEAWRCHLS
jgi:hypothetical protein